MSTELLRHKVKFLVGTVGCDQRDGRRFGEGRKDDVAQWVP
jgi:hypothetical protein